MYVEIDKTGKIVQELSLPAIKAKHRKTAAFSGSPERIEVESDESIKARMDVKRDIKEAETEEEAAAIEAKMPEPVRTVYVKVINEPPKLDDEKYEIKRGAVKRVDGKYKYTYTNKKRTAAQLKKIEEAKAKSAKVEKVKNALKSNGLVAAMAIVLVKLADKENIEIPEVLRDAANALTD